jgi:hypothetical protein
MLPQAPPLTLVQEGLLHTLVNVSFFFSCSSLEATHALALKVVWTRRQPHTTNIKRSSSPNGKRAAMAAKHDWEGSGRDNFSVVDPS